jgi:hypothetical protein
MQFEHLSFDEEPLSREDLLRIKGGASALYTVYITTPCNATGNSQVTDCADAAYD